MSNEDIVSTGATVPAPKVAFPKVIIGIASLVAVAIICLVYFAATK